MVAEDVHSLVGLKTGVIAPPPVHPLALLALGIWRGIAGLTARP